jgi:hypothetical protein
MPIRRQLLLWIVVPIVLIYGAVLLVERAHLRSRAFAQVDAQYREVLARQAESLSSEGLRARLAARGVAETLLQAKNPAAMIEEAARRVFAEASIVWALRVTLDSSLREHVVFRVERAADLTVQRLDKPGRVPTGWSSVRTEGDRRHARYAAVASDGDERTIRVTVEVPAKVWGERLATPIVDRSLLLMLDTEGRYLWHYSPGVMEADLTIYQFGEKVGDPVIPSVADAALRGEAGRQRMDRGFITPEPYQIYYWPVAGPNWTLITAVPEWELYEPARTALIQSGLVMLGGLVLIVAVVWWSGGRVARPLERIAAAAGRLEAGTTYTQ